MTLKTRIAIVVAAAIACVAWLVWRSTKTPRFGTIENPFAPMPIEVRFHNEKVGEVTVDKGPVTILAPRHLATWKVTDEMELFLATPCGVRRLDKVYPVPDEDDHFHVDQFHSYWVASVDNREGPARRLRLGELDIEVPAGKVLRRELYVEPCETMRVTLDGEDLGVVSGGHGFLVDPTGKRCYRISEVTYGMPSLFLPADPKTARYSGKKLYGTPDIIEHLLEPAPDKVETYTMKGLTPSTTRREVLDCD